MIKIKSKLRYVQRYASSKFSEFWNWKYRLKMYWNEYRTLKEKSKTFETTLSLDDLTGWRGGNGGFLWLDSDEVINILGDNDHSFRYLFRRFGYPMHGYDGRKSLCEFVINTPTPFVKLEIRVSGSNMYFSRCISPELEKELRNEALTFNNRNPVKWTYQHLALQALYTTVKDLLKPVQIRDVYLNINGEYQPKHSDEDGEPLEPIAKKSPMSGYGIGHVAVALGGDNKGVWWQLMEKIEKIGEGDFDVGTERVLKILGESNEN